MKFSYYFCGGCILIAAVFIELSTPTCVLESDFGFKINCAFKKSGLFRVRNLGGFKAHASLGFSLGDELGFEQSLTNLDPSRRRSVSVKNGAPTNVVAETTARSAGKQEKRGKQNRIMMRPPPPNMSRPSQTAMNRLTSLHRQSTSTMRPIIVSAPTADTQLNQANPTATIAKPYPMGVPPFKPLPPKEDTLKVLPIAATTKTPFTPLQVPQSKGPGLVYPSENYPIASHNQIHRMVSQMAIPHMKPHQLFKITPTPLIYETSKYYPLPTTVHPFVPMPLAAPPIQSVFTMMTAPAFKEIPSSFPSLPQSTHNTLSPVHSSVNPVSDFVDPAPVQIHELANNYLYNTKKVDDYNTISGYGDDTQLKFNKEDINAKIAEIAKAGNISMDAVEAAIALRQQQLLNKYANLPVPTTSTTTSSSTTTTTSTEAPLMFQPEPEEIKIQTQKPKRVFPTTGKVMNAPREYYPVGYEKNFDDQFQSKVDLPETNFHCGDQKYFPGLYGDENLGCMVFHVCALTDDGLVMKSFLCPESTLFDQTILKCNWWFYVDCKNTRRLYDTNIPVSKSYQLMKALTFFSSYKKDMQDKDQTSSNPEDEEGIKEAISILENQSLRPDQSSNTAIHIVTPQPMLDERNNHRYSDANETHPVYRGNRNSKVNDSTRRKTSQPKITSENRPEFRLVTVNADYTFSNETKSSSDESNVKNSTENVTSSESAERKYRRRLRLAKNSNTSTVKPKVTTTTLTTTTQVTTTTSAPTTTKYYGNPSVEILQQEIRTMESMQASEKQETLADQVDVEEINRSAENLPPVKRFYRSSAEIREKDSVVLKEEKEMAMVNNEKVQVIRPTSSARLVGESPTSKVAIAKLDEAILGKPFSARYKKSYLTIVTPTKLEDSKT